MKFNLKTCLLLAAIGIGMSSSAVAAESEPIDELKLDEAVVKKLWEEHCNSCHGKDGKGRTRAGRMNKVKDFTDLEYQKTFTNKKGFKAIKEGMEVDGKEKMKPLGDKLKDEEIKALTAYVRRLLPEEKRNELKEFLKSKKE